MGLIAWDCDGPLAQFTRGLCAGLTARGFGRDESSIHHWDLSASLSVEEFALVPAIVGAPGFCAGLQWVPGMMETVSRLRALGADAVCVTSPYDSWPWVRERQAWLACLFTRNDVMFVDSRRKALVRADVLVEDHPGTACAWLDLNPTGHAILVDRPWNQPTSREFWPHERLHRAKTATDVFVLAAEYAT